jgi:hypothetical protein
MKVEGATENKRYQETTLMIKLLLSSALGWLFLTMALPAALSEPAKAPVYDPCGGVTQISFTRTISRHPDPREYEKDVKALIRGEKLQPRHGDSWGYEETVTFYRDRMGDSAGDIITSNDTIKTVTLLPSADPNDPAPTPEEDLAGNFRGTRSHILDFEFFTKLLASDKFFEGSNRYIGYVNGRSDIGYPLSPFITIRAVRNGTTKTVTMDAFPPTQMWALQAALRGVAADMVWRKVDKTAEASGVKPH